MKNDAVRRTKSAQEFLRIEAIDGQILWTTDKYLFAFVRVRGMDNSLFDEADHEAVTDALTAALSEQTQPFQIVSVPRALDTQGMMRELEALRDGADEARCALIDGERSALEDLAECREPCIFLKLWAAASPNADRMLLDRAKRLAAALRENRVDAYLLEDAQIRELCMLYAEPGVRQETESVSDVPILAGRQRLLTRRSDSHEALLEQIAPVSLIFGRDSLTLGGTRCRCYGVTRYPAELGYGWAVKLMQATDTVTCITYTPGSAALGETISRSALDAEREAVEERDLRTRKRLMRSSESAGAMLDEMDAKNMPVGLLSIVAMPFAQSDVQLEEACRSAVSRYAAKKLKLKPLAYLQAQALLHISPYAAAQREIEQICARIVPLQTLMGGYPCTVSTLRDDHGVYFARTEDRGIVSLDIRTREPSRTNGHGIVTGVTGMGKSTVLKHLLLSAYMQGMRCVVIDPEREFRDICTALGGAWWNAGGGQGKVNPLQVQLPALDTQDEGSAGAERRNLPLPQQVSYFLTILRYRFQSLTEIQARLLEDALWQLYDSFGMHLDDPWEAFAAREPTDYPVLSDLWRTLGELEARDERYADLALLLGGMANGADSVVWNGSTDINLESRMVVIDTKSLYDSDTRGRAAQYYNLMRMIFSAAAADKETPYFIVCDEAQLLFDPELPQIAHAVKNMADRLRKYEGCLWLAFRGLRELRDERGDGQAIIDNAAYKILLGTEGTNLSETVELFRLTHAEEKFLHRRQRGRALALIGEQHLKLDFEIPAYKLTLIGKGGGR